MKEVLCVDGLKEALLSEIRIQFCSNSHISGMYSPIIEDMDGGKQVYVVETGRRKLQRSLSAYNCYGTVSWRFDSVMVHVGTVCAGNVTNCNKSFAEVLGEIEVKSPSIKLPGSGIYMAHAKRNYEICERNIEGEYVFLQYYHF